MGNSTNNKQILFSLIFDLHKEINSFNEKSDFGKEKIINTLELFFLSDKFIPFAIYELTEKGERYRNNIIIILEQKKEYLSLEILCNLIERLNSENFKLQLKKIIQIRTNKKEDEVLQLYFNQNKDKIEKSRDIVRGGRFEGFNASYIGILGKLYHYFFSFKFREILLPQEKYKNIVSLESFKEYYLDFENYFNLDECEWKKESLEYFINFLAYLKDSNDVKEIQQLFLFFLNLIKNKKKIIKEIVSQVKISYFIFGLNYGNYIIMNFSNIDKKLIWAIYDSNITILEGKKSDNEKFSLDIFIKGSDIFSFRSIFTNIEIIIFDVVYLLLILKSKKELTIEKFKQDKDKIFDNIQKKKELNIYINIKNKIINYNNSFDLLLNELINLKAFEEQKTKEESSNVEEGVVNVEQDNKNVKDDKNKKFDTKDTDDLKLELKKGNDNNQKLAEKINDKKEMDDLKLELKKEKVNNQKLSEKINELENELNVEKMKNKEFEKQIINLKNELNSKINLEANLQEKEKSINIDFKNESKEKFLEAIMEKDKEIKELKLKLSRYPFELMEGEKIMAIILTSVDQKIHYSIICKNKEKFNIIENKFYEAYPDYIETENFFTLNGKKINKYKTLEENNIKNNDIILLNVFE